MDVSESQSRRDVETARRLLQEREAEHVRELDNLKDSQAQQLKDLDESQSESLKRVHKKTEEVATNARERYDSALEKATDSFERRLQEQKREAYDKFGRMNAENARDRASAQAIKARQIRDMADTGGHRYDAEKNEREQAMERLRTKFDQDRLELKRGFDAKLNEQAERNVDLNSRTALEARDKVDSAIRSTSEERAKDKAEARLQYRKLATDSTAERDNMKRAFNEREKGLSDEKLYALTKGEGEAKKTYEEYRQRASENFQRAMDDSNFKAAQLNRDHANSLAIREQEHQKKLNETGSQFRKAENELKLQNKAERARNELKDGLNERRHQQDVQLSNEAQRKSNALSTEIMRSRYNDQLRELEEKSQTKFGEYSQSMQQKMTEQELKTASERARTLSQKNKELAENELMRNQEKYLLNKSHEDRFNSFADLKQRQGADQEQYMRRTVTETREKADKEISKNTRESQTKLFLAQEELKNQTREMEEKRQLDNQTNDSTYRDRVKRLTNSYNRSISTQQEGFQEATEGLRSENMMQRARDRGQADHERKMQLYELQSKNRVQAISYENKINDIKDEFENELNKQKLEGEKAMRALIKKTKESQEEQQQLHARELDSKDRQLKERLKLQEDAFKEQLERLKRSNELALKKS